MKNANKFNGFESYLILEGVDKVRLEMIKEIRAIEESGKNPLMTEGYVEMIFEELKNKVIKNTLRNG